MKSISASPASTVKTRKKKKPVLSAKQLIPSKNLRKALQESETRYLDLLRGLPVAVYTCDAQGRILLFNEAAVTLWGRRPKTHAELWCGSHKIFTPHGQPVPLDTCPMADAIQNGTSINAAEIVVERPDGTQRNVLAHPQALFDASGKVIGAMNVLIDITDRKKIERDFGHWEQLYRAIGESINYGIWVCDTQGRNLYASDSFLNLVGLTQQECSEFGWGKVLHPDDAEDTLAAWKECTRDGTFWEREHRFKGVDGQWHSILARGVPVRDENGTIIRWAGINLDISALKKNEKILRQQNERLRLLSDALAYLLGARDPQQIVRELLPRVAHHLDTDMYLNFMVTPEGDALELHAYGGLPPEAAKEMKRIDFGQAICGKVAATRKALHVTDIQNSTDERVALVRSFGIQAYACNPLIAGERFLGTLSFATRTRPSFDPDEVDFAKIVSQYVALALDRALSEQALGKRTRSLEVINQVGSALAAELDLAKLVQSVTDAGREISGAAFGAFFYNAPNPQGEAYTLYTLSGAPREAFEKFGMPRNTPLFAPTFRGEGIVRIGDVLQDPRYGKNPPHHGMPKGHLPVRSYLAVPVTSRSGQVLGGLFFGHPEPNVFTEESEKILGAIAAQAAIAIDNANLYQSLQRELDEKQKAELDLRTAQLLLEEHADQLEKKVRERTASLSEAVAQMEEFSYSVSHDLRAPLRAMHAYAEALMEDHSGSLDGQARGYLERILRNSRRMEQLTHDVLTYSRIARDEVQLTPVNLEKTLDEILWSYAGIKEKADIQVARPLHNVLGHESSLGQCLSNLIANAVKFVPPGVSPQVRIFTEHSNGRVKIWVQDNGIGIPPEYQSRLFCIFERLAREGEYEGTGIGLAIVRKAMDKMNGRYGVESDGTNGSRFWLELPCAL
jgi:PAS domain S-box-containing protein